MPVVTDTETTNETTAAKTSAQTSAQTGSSFSVYTPQPARPAQRIADAHRMMRAGVPVARSAYQLYDAITKAVGDIADEESEALKSRSKKAATKASQIGTTDKVKDDAPAGYSPVNHFFALAHALAAAIGLFLSVGALVALAFIDAPVSTAIVLTALVLAALWGAEILSRQ